MTKNTKHMKRGIIILFVTLVLNVITSNSAFAVEDRKGDPGPWSTESHGLVKASFVRSEISLFNGLKLGLEQN